jgi:DNA-binding LacI/PurR family transcriptional regulator
MAAQKYKFTAQLLRRDLESFPDGVLPSIDELARRHHVSYQTTMKALHQLRASGEVKLQGGRWIASTATAGRTRGLDFPGSAHGKLHDSLKARIVDGTYESGSLLPKLDFFVINERVSKHTVHRAFALLARQNLIHKQGKQWLVGPPRPRPGRSPDSSADNRPAVLLVFYSETWMKPFFGTFISPFSTAFVAELQKCGFQPFLASQNVISMHDQETTQGFNQAQETIRKLGNRYKGALVYSFANAGELDQWLPFLQSFSMPVVYFDSTDEGSRFVRGNLGLKENYYRLFLDELTAITIAIESLAKLGHTTIGMPDLTGREDDWPVRRIRRAQKAAQAMDPPVKVLRSVHTEKFWDFYPTDHPNAFEQRVSAALPGTGARKLKGRDLLLQCTPSLASLLDQGTTAVLAANDLAALEYYHWFRQAGIRVPRDISLLSFDNMPDLMAYPLSSIDFGFRRLGYLAAHIFIDDIPVRADKQGNMPSPCMLVDRGSTAARH